MEQILKLKEITDSWDTDEIGKDLKETIKEVTNSTLGKKNNTTKPCLIRYTKKQLLKES